MRISALLVSSLALALSTVADADAQRGGHRSDSASNPTLTLFDQPGFRGRSITLDGDAPDLRWVQFNDLASSYSFSGGRWEVCLEPNYRGTCHLVDADNENMTRWAFNNRITSVRALHRPDRDRRQGITLYSGRNYTGQAVHVRDVEFDLDDLRFDNRANSIEVHSGTWTLCEDRNFSDRCVEFSRDSNDLKLFRMDGRVSSAGPDGIPRRDPIDDFGPGYGGGYGSGYGSSLGASGAVRGVNSLFVPQPQTRGYPISACAEPNGRRCGEPVARQICRAEGYSRVAHFDLRRASSQLWFIGANSARGGRNEIVDVLCVR
jgi:hypothetical protein